MLRDKNLIPLSHQHQHCLALCVRLDRAIQAGDVDLEAWQAEIQQIFEQEITFHFAAEENELFPAAARLSGTATSRTGTSYRSCDAAHFLFTSRLPFSSSGRTASSRREDGFSHS